MNGACPCGVSFDSIRNNSCHECGTAFCRGCSVELSSHTYCGWCAASVARAAER
jgi:hypothetical protein